METSTKIIKRIIKMLSMSWHRMRLERNAAEIGDEILGAPGALPPAATST